MCGETSAILVAWAADFFFDGSHLEVPTDVIVKLKLMLIYDRQSVGQSVLVSGAHLGPATNFSFSLKSPSDIAGLLCCSALSGERTGL
jgi:hypothetical protein